MLPLRVWTCTSFTGHYPVDTAAVIVAYSAEGAADMLNAWLRDHGLPGDAKAGSMIPLDTDRITVRVLCDGDY